jgi:hypothetical protein
MYSNDRWIRVIMLLVAVVVVLGLVLSTVRFAL